MKNTAIILFTRKNALVNLKGRKEQASLVNGRGKEVMGSALKEECLRRIAKCDRLLKKSASTGVPKKLKEVFYDIKHKTSDEMDLVFYPSLYSGVTVECICFWSTHRDLGNHNILPYYHYFHRCNNWWAYDVTESYE